MMDNFIKDDTMKITKRQLRRVIKEAVYGGETRGGFGNMTVRDIEGMLPRAIVQKYPGAASALQAQALQAGFTTNQLADEIEAIRISDWEHPSQFFERLGFRW